MRFLVAVLLAFHLCGASLSWQRPPLVDIHSPDLSQFEPEVRAQIKSQQDLLTATLKDATASDGKLGTAYGMLGELYHAYALLSPAEECYMNASRLASTDLRWNYLLAKVQQALGHAEPAIRSYQVATTLQMTFVPAHINLGNLYLELNRLDEAKARFELALQKEPNNAAAYYGLGQVALSKRNYGEAVQQLEKALTLVPEASRIHYPLALAYRGLGNLEKAREHLAQQGTVGVRVDDPYVKQLTELLEGARVHMIRGKLALEAKRYEDAAVEFRKAIESDRESVSAYVNLGATLTQLGDPKGAAEQFENALRFDPNNLTAHFNLAILLSKQDKHQQAVEHLKVVLKANENDPDARLFMARELTKSDRVDEAIAEYSRLAELDPNQEAAVIEVAQLLQRKGEFQASLNTLENAYRKYPQRLNTKLMLTYTLATSARLELRDGGRALKLAQELYAANPSLQNGSLVVLSLAEVGRCSEAAEVQRKLIEEASRQGKQELLENLKANLSRYESAQTCRP